MGQPPGAPAAMSSSWITVGLSAHRVETLAAAGAAMVGHRLVALEEPPGSTFRPMLAGELPIPEHLEQLVPEFPEYSSRQCAMLRTLYLDGGIEVVQVEPFMAELEAIHDGFESGGRPEELREDPTRWRVYRAERAWTDALFGYYAASGGADFDRTVDAVCAFARVDARRGRLRDAMRARQLTALATGGGGVYAEAGYIHAGLVGELRRAAPGIPVRPLWLNAAEIRELRGAVPLLGPGDRLTLALARGGEVDRAWSRLLAARSLVHVAVSVQEEMLPTPEHPFPHLADDVETCRLVGRLSFADCRVLYPKVRTLSPPDARRVVRDLLS